MTTRIGDRSAAKVKSICLSYSPTLTWNGNRKHMLNGPQSQHASISYRYLPCSDYPLPRLGQGAFRMSVETIYKVRLTGLQETTKVRS